MSTFEQQKLHTDFWRNVHMIDVELFRQYEGVINNNHEAVQIANVKLEILMQRQKDIINLLIKSK